jgi:hypothetical protein
MLGLRYFPNRYRAHILPPLALSITGGASVLQRFGLRRVAESLEQVTGPARALSPSGDSMASSRSRLTVAVGSENGRASVEHCPAPTDGQRTGLAVGWSPGGSCAHVL